MQYFCHMLWRDCFRFCMYVKLKDPFTRINRTDVSDKLRIAANRVCVL